MKKYALLFWENERMKKAVFDSKEDAQKYANKLENRGLHAHVYEVEVR